MKFSRHDVIGLTLGLILSLPLFFLSTSRSTVFLSPDETANVATARLFGERGTFHFLQDPELTRRFPWMHPRSFVNQIDPHATWMIQISFVGFSAFVGIIWRFFGETTFAFLTPLLVASACIPLWKLHTRRRRWAQVAAVVGWLTFPMVILYANRGMYAHLPQLSLVLWGCWLMVRQRSKRLEVVAAALMFGLAILLRPTEGWWIVLIAGFIYHFLRTTENKKEWTRNLFIGLSTLFIVAIGVVLLHWSAYGSPFITGYQLRDPVVTTHVAESAVATIDRSADIWRLPFGFHPRNVLFNVRWYLGWYLLPWTMISLFAAGIIWVEKRDRRWLLLAGIICSGLILIYGQGLYQDHVQLNHISLANSFLRYLSPITLGYALALPIVVMWILSRNVRGKELLAAGVLIMMAGLGLWTTFLRDDEGLLQNRRELQKYAEVREEAIKTLPPSTVVFSERSDKIFFPVFRAVSPLPSRERLHEVMASGAVPGALFIRTLTSEQDQAWRKAGFVLTPLLEAGNESLYRIDIVP